MELQFFGDSIWRTSITAYILGYCFGSGNWINYCESKKCHHHSMKSCCQRLGNGVDIYRETAKNVLVK
ncbi:unnamed protein product [Rhizophagus irregularis]|nr:unnamed protein product [Rhizophagus irregularis]